MFWFSKSLEEPRATPEPIFSHAQLPVEGQVPEPERAALPKAEVPAHAQRMSSLLAADRGFEPCRESKGGRVRWGGEVRAGRREGVGRRGRRKWHVHGEGPTQGLWGPGQARSARRTCVPCS
jgi:hypothetical protein